MATVEASTGVAVITVCLDPTSYEAISYFIAGVPGAVVVGNLDHGAVARRISRCPLLCRLVPLRARQNYRSHARGLRGIPGKAGGA